VAKKKTGVVLSSEGWSGETTGSWSNKSNIARSKRGQVSYEGKWGNEKLKVINTLGGNDVISGGREGLFGAVYLRGASLITESGNDTIEGKDNSYGSSIDLYNSKVSTGNGSDRFIAIGGTIRIDESQIDTGIGDDEIKVEASGAPVTGLVVDYASGSIDTGTGNDRIDILTNYNGVEITSGGQILMGDGDDTLYIRTTYSDRYAIPEGIISYGLISMGEGNDTIDVLGNYEFGFIMDNYYRESYFDMGGGNDVVKGFGYGQIRGGSGNDQLLLPAGTYTLTGSQASTTVTTSPGVKIRTVELADFEKIGSAVSGLTIETAQIPIGGSLVLTVDGGGNIAIV